MVKYINVPIWPEGGLTAFMESEAKFPDPEAFMQTKVIEVPEVKVEWCNNEKWGHYRVSVLYRGKIYSLHYSPEAIPIKVSGVQPFIDGLVESFDAMSNLDPDAVGWFRQELMSKCFPGQKPSDWPDLTPGPNFSSMAQELPVDLKQKVKCPHCRRTYTLGDAIIHLNDGHKATREYIADWLDKLADSGKINIDMKTPEEKKKDAKRARQKDSGSKDAALLKYISAGFIDPNKAKFIWGPDGSGT